MIGPLIKKDLQNYLSGRTVIQSCVILIMNLLVHAIFAESSENSMPGRFFGIIVITIFMVLSINARNLFIQDKIDGSLDFIYSVRGAFDGYVSAKIIALWLAYGMPMFMVAAVFVIIGGGSLPTYGAKLMLFSIIITQVAVLGESLAIALVRQKFLTMLLTFPVLIPSFIFVASEDWDVASIGLLGNFFLTLPVSIYVTSRLLVALVKE